MTLAYEVNGRPGHAAVWLPEGFDAARAWPLVVFLHAYEERGERNEHLGVGIGPALAERRDLYPAIVLLPQCPADCVWEVYDRSWAEGKAPALDHVDAALDAALERFPVDAGRVALTGASMGGYGAFAMAASRPDTFRAVGPVCGGGRAEDAPALSGQDLWVWHGAADDVVPVSESRDMVAAIQAAGGASVRYSEPADAGHAVWDQAYRDGAFAAFLCGHEGR